MELIENEKKILSHIRKNGKTSKLALAGEDGINCAWATISKLVNRLEKNQLICKTGTDGISRRYGKNAYLYDIPENEFLSLGIDIEKSTTTCQWTNLAGKVLQSSQIDTPPTLDFPSLLNFLHSILKSELKKEDPTKESFLGVGVGMPSHHLQQEPMAYEKLREALEKSFQTTLYLRNNIHAYANHYSHTHLESDFYMIAIRTGVGGAFVVNQQLYRGLNFSGEVGHIYNPQGNSYEESLSIPALTQFYEKQFNQPCPNIDQWSELILKQDPKFLKLMDYFYSQLTSMVDLIIKVLDVPKIIIATPWTLSLEHIPSYLKELVQSKRLEFVTFAHSHFAEAAAFNTQSAYLM